MTPDDGNARVDALRGVLQGTWDETRSRRALTAAVAQARRRTRTRRVVTAAAVVGVCGLVGGVVLQRREASVTSAPHTRAPSEQVVWFEDGSRATLLAADTSLLVPQQEADAQNVELKVGRARFDIVPRKARRFRVLAGPATIEVLGTSFVVERMGAQTRVSVLEGRVRVTDGDAAIVLGPTDAMTFPREEPGGRAQDEAAQPASGPEPEANAGPAAATPAEAAAPLREPAPLPHGLASSAPEGQRRGRPLPPRARADELAAADAARVRGNYDEAAQNLERFIREHANDPRAGAAAFTLGRIHMDDRRAPKEAAVAFERAITLGTGRVLETDAFARAAFAWQRSGDLTRAAARASDYLAREPQGEHAAAMRAIAGKRYDHK